MKTEIQVQRATLQLIPIQTRLPLKFGKETLSSVTCARVHVEVLRVDTGVLSTGTGETPLSVQWVWPSDLPYQERYESLLAFTNEILEGVQNEDLAGDAMQIGWKLIEDFLPRIWMRFNAPREPHLQLPWLAALVCASAFDLAVHDAFGKAYSRPTYEMYGPEFLNQDLSTYLEPAADRAHDLSFQGKYPCDFFRKEPLKKMMAWHLVGGVDALDASELSGNEPVDGHPVTLLDWIQRDGLKALKIKLRGHDEAWDYERLIRVGKLGIEHGVLWLSADFNCTVSDLSYVIGILNRLREDEPGIYARLLYLEQPFPYELESFPVAVHAISSMKPLFLDESAHDWREVRRGRELGWNGVALKTCKTQTGALLSLCWAQAHGMSLMVQDLTNPMLAQITHVQLASHAPTIAGVETNAMQFYPEASRREEKVHPGLYQRRGGCVDLGTIEGSGLGYRMDEMDA